MTRTINEISSVHAVSLDQAPSPFPVDPPAAVLHASGDQLSPGIPAGHRPLITVTLPCSFRLVVSILQQVVDLEPAAQMVNDPTDSTRIHITVPGDHVGFARLGGE